MLDGCRRLTTVREWPAEFRPYAPGYQPCFAKRWVLTQANQELNPFPVSKLVEGKNVRVIAKKKPTVPKYCSISEIRDFPPIPGRFNPYLSNERK
jgi:hypothetical protein